MVTGGQCEGRADRGRRDAAVLVLFSGPRRDSPSDGGLHRSDADLLVTVRASTLRHHAGQAAFPGGAADPGDEGPVPTALREAHEETGIDTTGCTRWPPWSGCSSRHRVSMSCRSSPIRPIRAR